MGPLLSTPTDVALLKQRQTLSLGHVNAYSCPKQTGLGSIT
jgi:hypothetical protein